MPVEVTKHAGFCMGVKRAIEISLQTVNEKGHCYTLGELIHNRQVVQKLREKGIVPITTVNQIDQGTLIIRSHGVAPQVYSECRAKGITVVDCTCPFVQKLHQQVQAFDEEGYQVILVGDKDHPEVLGTVGYAVNNPVQVISSLKEAQDLLPLKKALLVAQTTFPVDKWEDIAKAITPKVEELVIKKTICSATAQRQEEAKALAKKVDKMIVVGGRNSANTQKLYEACKTICPNTILVECAAEIPPHFTDIPGKYTGITAGASTPDWSLKEVVTNMMDKEIKDPIQDTTEETEVSVEAAPVEASEIAQPAETQPEVVAEVVDEIEEQEPSASAADTAADDFMAGVEATLVKIRRGQTVVGTVVQITDDEVCVNIGYKSDGLIKKEDLSTKDVELGDEIEVEVVKLNDGDGNVILSQRNIVNQKAWDALMQKFENNEYVQGVGKDAVKGGLLAEVEGKVRAFVPASLLDRRYVEKIADFVGKPVELKIVEVDQQKKRIVASRRAVLEEQQVAKKAAAWERLTQGDIVKGIVRRLTDFGAFVDLDGVDGLIHITDLSWSRIKHPSDVVSPNQEVEVEILSLDPQRERIQLGYKQLKSHPWDNVDEKYPEGTIAKGKVVRITDFGAFIELEPGVDGLVHISQLSPKRVQKVEDVISVDQIVDVKVLKVDPEARRISLSIREAMEDLGIAFEDAEENWDAEQAPEAIEAVEEVVEEAVEVAQEVAVETEAVAEVVEATEEVVEAAEEVVEAAEEVAEAQEEAQEDITQE